MVLLKLALFSILFLGISARYFGGQEASQYEELTTQKSLTKTPNSFDRDRDENRKDNDKDRNSWRDNTVDKDDWRGSSSSSKGENSWHEDTKDKEDWSRPSKGQNSWDSFEKTTTYAPFPKGGSSYYDQNQFDSIPKKSITTTKKPWYVRFKNWSGEQFKKIG